MKTEKVSRREEREREREGKSLLRVWAPSRTEEV
jgi:hypothetical protein